MKFIGHEGKNQFTCTNEFGLLILTTKYAWFLGKLFSTFLDLKGPQSRIFLFHKSHFYPYIIIYPFLKSKIEKKKIKKVQNLGALPRISSLKVMAVAGLKIEF